MKNWALALVAGLLVLSGCSGGGGGSNGGGGGGGNSTDSSAFITLPNVPGLLQHVFLTGQGRAPGDLSAVVRRVSVDDAFGFIPQTLTPALQLWLNGYTHNIANQNVPTAISRVFDHYNLEIQKLIQDNGDGTFTEYTNGSQPIVQDQFDAYFRLFPARTTQIAVRLDDSMFDVSSGVTFDRNQFITANYFEFLLNPSRMNGFLGDYVMFDLSSLSAADQPDVPDPNIGGKATALWVSGDNFAIGTVSPGDSPDPYPFVVLTPAGYISGSQVGERTGTDSSGHTVPIPGTYSLVQDDPRDSDPNRHITALMGTYQTFTKTIASVGTNPEHFEIIAFPSTFDDGVDDVILFNYDSGVITKIYFGQLDMNAGTISAFPVSQISDPTDIRNEITGTVTSLLDKNGVATTDVQAARAGRYTLNDTNLPATFSTSGRFIVYRR